MKNASLTHKDSESELRTLTTPELTHQSPSMEQTPADAHAAPSASVPNNDTIPGIILLFGDHKGGRMH
eukprot:scaffold437_cov122-Isochrysis_galbana.AAC.4